MSETYAWFNPSCSKCRGLQELLKERGVEAVFRNYLEDPPSADEIRVMVKLLGTRDIRALVRAKEPLYQELGLGEADADTLLQALVEHPQLLERPVFVHAGRAVVARPPEKALQLLD